MDTDLRVPLTSEHKAILDDATSDAPEGKAEWARVILLAAAKRRIARRGKGKGEQMPSKNETGDA